MDKETLIAFEDSIREEFKAGLIKFPIHFSKGNEEQLIEIFKDVKPEDWVFSTHRSHYHALLKGIPPEWIKEQIRHGNSMHLMNPEYRFFASAIVTAPVPVALGVALAIKRQGGTNKVWCFTGDMASMTGIFNECEIYAWRNDLPIKFVVEDNRLSTNTPTREAWGEDIKKDFKKYIQWYEYDRQCPHINIDSWVEFK